MDAFTELDILEKVAEILATEGPKAANEYLAAARVRAKELKPSAAAQRSAARSEFWLGSKPVTKQSSASDFWLGAKVSRNDKQTRRDGKTGGKR